MTPKEAFRKLSHKFHGKGPGKMKQEKRQKQFQEELKLKQMNAGDTPLMAMEKIRDAQAKLHAPYLVISGHIKPGQTSDPRSGFATVEKEPVGSLTPMLGDNKNIGSLTPMLGDKKVAHFLGIKRKPESGSMGPPPNKKPKDH
jgi:U4/U6.U5 tri-snRNP-associated protein 1